MSLQENLNMVKEELSSEEKFFEKAVVTEKFIKKYKKLLIGSAVAVAVLVVGNIAYEWNQQRTITAANEALMQLRANPLDKAAGSELQTLSPALYDLWSYNNALEHNDTKRLQKLSGSQTILIGDLASYEAAQRTQDKAKLQSYGQKQGSIYRDLAEVEVALIDMKSGAVDKAHTKLATVAQEQNSPLANIAKGLLHYGVK